MTKTNLTQEIIKHAAVRCYSGMTMLGKSHSDCIHKAAGIGIQINQKADAQGFFTNHGRFLTRPEAALVAIAANQVLPNIKILFSEDLWSPSSGGVFDYDYVKGYFK